MRWNGGRCAVRSYVEAVRALACEILEVVTEGMGVPHTSVFSALIRDADADSRLRLNHYPPVPDDWDTSPSDPRHQNPRIGLGEHTDPQILTLLRSNDVRGLQIPLPHRVWVPVDPHPQAYFATVRAVLHVLLLLTPFFFFFYLVIIFSCLFFFSNMAFFFRILVIVLT